MAVTDQVEKVLLRLPVWIEMTPAQVQAVLEAVRQIATTLPADLR
jgi:dTDP-4-amino-4,6-dideoxygalactose transaminase